VIAVPLQDIAWLYKVIGDSWGARENPLQNNRVGSQGNECHIYGLRDVAIKHVSAVAHRLLPETETT
jgi:hypothetical protein